jgi:hypothetical protein
MANSRAARPGLGRCDRHGDRRSHGKRAADGVANPPLRATASVLWSQIEPAAADVADLAFTIVSCAAAEGTAVLRRAPAQLTGRS